MSTQYTHRPSWLEGGEAAVAMAHEDGLMPAAQHTPGPWNVGESAPRIVYDSRGWAIADAKVFHGNRKGGEDFANALLIAAAPDLLAACIEARVRMLGVACMERHVAMLDDAIAKATGSAS